MSLINILLATGASLLFLALVFIPMEKAFPAKSGQHIFRPKWFLDLCYFLGQYLLWSSLVLKALNYVGIWVDTNIPLQFRNFIGEQPIWLQAIEVLMFSDLLIYWEHRLQHKYDFFCVA